jgi:S1-C subfamily serine protease
MANPFVAHDLPDRIDEIAASVVALSSRHRGAAGLLWQDGLVVTSASALWRSSSPSVILPDGERVAGEVLGGDVATDLAVVRLASAGAPVLGRETHAPSRVGDFVFAVARSASGRVQASFGFVGCVAGEWKTWRGARVEQLIRLDGGLYPGFEGAPVADAEGRLVGIASAALSRHHAIVLPVETVDRVVAQILAHGHVRRGHLGIAAQPVTVEWQGQDVEGLLVSSVVDDGPAARGGLKVADVILQVGATPVGTLDDLRDALPLDQTVVVRVLRGDRPVELSIAVAPRPTSRCG